MSTKATIQALINANLADGSSITASEHRAVEDMLLNELYPTPIYETRDSNTITTENTNSAFLTNSYQINIVKQGRVVTIIGKIINGSNNIIGNTLNSWFFQITASEYLQNTSMPRVFGVVKNDGYVSSVELYDNKLFCDYINAFGELEFQLTYFTQN